MTGTSQQVKEWGRHGVPPTGRGRGARRAVGGRSAALARDIARLRTRSLPGGMSWSDLLHEAVLRALTGARPWPPGVPLLAFLAGVMRSLCDEQWRRYRRQDHLPTAHDSGARIGTITRDVLRWAASTGATPLSVADGIVQARIRRG
jgi:DNA-directed RNA polymerase specialized sigma24 family protein